MKIPREAGIFAAVLGASAVVTAGVSWLEAALGWAVCGLLRLWLPQTKRQNEKKSVAWVQLILGLLIGAAGVFVAQQAFPEKSANGWITIGMILLLWRSLIGEKDNGIIVGNVLGLIMLVLFGAIVLFGLADVHWEELLPKEFELGNTLLVILVTSPWWWARQNRDSWGWFAGAAVLGIGMSLLIRGILGNELAEYVELPLYTAVQMLHIFGSSQRLEGLAAAGILVGAFALLLLAGEMLREAKRMLAPRQSKKSWYGILCGILLIMVVAYMLAREAVSSWAATTFWAMIAIFTLGMVLLENMKKVLDK
jgi:hypothetical protein